MSKNSSPQGYAQLLRTNPNFRWLWLGQIISLLGDWFNLIATAALLASLTHSGLALGSLFVVRMMAPFLISPIAGVVVDRVSRKHILIASDMVRGVVVIGFLFVRDPGDVWLLYTLTALQLGISGFFFPARNAILSELVAPEALGTANTISTTTWSVMLAFGAALGGIVAGVWGVYQAFAIDALTFFVSAIAIAKIRTEAAPSEETPNAQKRSLGHALHEYLEGLRYLKREHDILFVAIQKGGFLLFVGATLQVIEVRITETLFVIGKGGGVGLGILFSVVGLGTGLGPLIARRFTGDRDKALRVALVVAYLFGAAGLLIMSTLASFPILLLGASLCGVGTGLIWVFSTQLLLVNVQGKVRGRVFSTEFAIFTLCSAIGAGLVGFPLDTSLGVSGVLIGLAIGLMLPGALWTWWWRRGRLAHHREL